MNKQEVISQLEELLKQDDVEQLATGIETAEAEFNKAVDEHENTLLEVFKAEGGEEVDFVPTKDDDDYKFRDLLKAANDKLEKIEKQQANSQEQSINIRRELIEQLKELVRTETDISRAFNAFKDIQQQWKEATPLPIKQFKQLQSEYSHQIDMFFYTIDIYRALKFHDFAKNLEIKKGLIEQVRQLLGETSLRKMESLVKSYQNEWIETGPVPNENWKEIRDEFRKATNEVYDKIQAHYDGLREQYAKNLTAKNELLDKVKALPIIENESHKKWQDATETLLELQKAWKTIGQTQKKDSERLWKEFRAASDIFFTKKKHFYDSRKEEFNVHRDQKMALIGKAETLKDSTDWKKTTDELVALQNQWKEIGGASQKDEQKLWNRFRAACNHFFEAKKQYYATLDDRLAIQLKEREDFIKQIDAFVPSGDHSKDLESLREFSNQWRTLPQVPRKDIDRINEVYKKTLDAKYDALNIGKQEKASIRYQTKVEQLKNTDQTGKALDNERRYIKEQMKKLEDTIALYENNLSFFGRSKGADALKADVLSKIEHSKEELKGWKDKLKVIQAMK